MKTWGDGCPSYSIEREQILEVVFAWREGSRDNGDRTLSRRLLHKPLAINVRFTTTEAELNALLANLVTFPNLLTSLSRCLYGRDKNKGLVFGPIKQNKQGGGPSPAPTLAISPTHPATRQTPKPGFCIILWDVLGLEWSWRITQGQPSYIPSRPDKS